MARRQNWTTKYEVGRYAPETPDTAPAEWYWLAKQIETIEPDTDDNTETYEYYDGYGVPEEATLSISQSYSVSGHRSKGDEAQDLIAEGELDADKRIIWLRITDEDGIYEGKASTSNINLRGGDANSPKPFECEIAWAGRPTITPHDEVGVKAPTAGV